jgi:hypothetical protein
LGNALILIHIFGERLENIRDAPASRGAGILPASRRAGILARLGQ